jgi:hypothetical protein
MCVSDTFTGPKGQLRKTQPKRVRNDGGAKPGRAALRAAGSPQLGRPRFQLTPAMREAVLTAFRTGADYATACGLAGISVSVLSRWLTEDSELAESVQKSRAEHIQTTLARLRELPAGRWQAAAWELERIYPERFGQGTRPEFSGATVRVEVTATFCAEMHESWKRFSTQVVEVKEDAKSVSDNSGYIPKVTESSASASPASTSAHSASEPVPSKTAKWPTPSEGLS